MIIYLDNCKKEATIENLYTNRTNGNPHKIEVTFKNSQYKFDVILDGRDNAPDCKISSFQANLYFRTQNGINKKRYANIKAIERAVKNIAKYYDYELENIIISKGEQAYF